MLRIARLTKTYPGDVRALVDVDLDIGPGLFGLLGPNGSGKSTLMRTLATLQTPDSGTVAFAGRDIFADPRAHRRQLGYLPQDFGVYPGISARALLDHLASLKGLPRGRARRAQIDELLARTNLWAHRKKAVSGFSGGMRQRFGIAQALLGDPRLIVVDEPTAGLDPEERHRFHDFLAEVGDQVVVVLSTHIVEDVRQLCPRVAILVQGRVEAEGAPRALIDRLNGRIWQKTVSRADIADAHATLPVLSTRLIAGRHQVRVLAEQPPAEGFAPRDPDLEDVYFAVLADRRAA